MKRIINFSKIFLLLVLALSLATCKKNKFLNVNNNPNYPATVTPALALPTCEANIDVYKRQLIPPPTVH